MEELDWGDLGWDGLGWKSWVVLGQDGMEQLG